VTRESTDALRDLALRTLNLNGRWELALERIINSPEFVRTAIRVAAQENPNRFGDILRDRPYNLGSTKVEGTNLIWEFDSTGNGRDARDETITFGVAIDKPAQGDWNGDGLQDLGVFRLGTWHIDSNGTRGWQGDDTSILYGVASDLPTPGDWNGDGKTDLGVFRNGFWYLDTNGKFGWQGDDTAIHFGVAGDIPVVGDWNGDGKDDIGVVRGTTWFLDSNGVRGYQITDVGVVYGLGSPKDIPVVGDWNLDGRDDIGVYRTGTDPDSKRWYLDANGKLGFQGDDTVISNYDIGTGTPIAVTLGGAFPQRVQRAAGAGRSVTQTDLNSIVDQAVSVWASAGISPTQVARLRQLDVRIVDLAGDNIGMSWPRAIAIDHNAGGVGWFVDKTPGQSEEYTRDAQGRLVAKQGSAAVGKVDLLSVVLHEMGHVLGIDEHDEHGLMAEILSPGRRELPSAELVDEVLASLSTRR
jgi:hypothetical protein